MNKGARGILLVCALMLLGRLEARADDDLWAALREGNAIALMRHATAPGTGDPQGFVLDDCATQRNLSNEGRAQARAIGERFRARGINQAEVSASRWCRALETAELLGLGEVTPLPALDSFFGARELGPARSDEVLAFLAGREGDRPLVLVTHQVNVTALTGVFPRSGEVVVARPADDGLEVLGTLPPP